MADQIKIETDSNTSEGVNACEQISEEDEDVDLDNESEEADSNEDGGVDGADKKSPEGHTPMESAVMRVEVTHKKVLLSVDKSSTDSKGQSSPNHSDTDHNDDNDTKHKRSVSESDTEQDEPCEQVEASELAEPSVLPINGSPLDKKASKVELLQAQDRQVSDLLSSEDDALLLHRPDFYSVLSDEDSFEWTFHNEKFSDLDIKFVPRVEERWAEGKAKSSLKGNASPTPESIPDTSEKQDHSFILRKNSYPNSETHISSDHPQKTESPKSFTNMTKVRKSSREIYQPSAPFVKHGNPTETKKHVEINLESVSQNENVDDFLSSKPDHNHMQDQSSLSGGQKKDIPGKVHWEKQYRTPYVRENVVFFQSSPTLTYKKTKLKFLENKSEVPSAIHAEIIKDKEDQLIWSSKARLAKESQNPLRQIKKPQMSIDKADEIIRRRNNYRKMCKLDEVEAKFISSNVSETVSSDTSFSPKINATADKDRRRSHPQILLSSSLESSLNKKHITPTSVQEAQTIESKQPDMERPPGQRRSAKDVIQWLFEGRLSDGSKLRRRRSSKDLGKTLKGGIPRPDSLRNWISLPSKMRSDSSRNSFRDRSQKFLTALEYFRRWARMVCLLLRAVGLKPKKPVTTNLDFLSWTVVYDEVLGISRLNYDHGTLTFDPDAYKANRELTIRPEVREILRLSAEERTDAQVHTAMKCLQHVVPAFSEFPVRVQQSMLKVCRHEEFESGRVIIRQGHRAENFYFIVSGSAVVTVMDSGENHVHTANLLGKGSSFGDLAFLNMAKRSATVTCRDTVEVICIERDDFINIFLRGVRGKEPAHFTFLREVDILKGWPVSALPQDNPRICAYTYVRRGVILSHDSATCDWIVVVVSGTCNIIKAMNDPGQKVSSLTYPPASQAVRKSSDSVSSRMGSASPSSRRGSPSPFPHRESTSPSPRRAARETISSPASSIGSLRGNGAENTNSRKGKRKGKLSVHFADLDLKESESTTGNKNDSIPSRKSEINRKTRHQLVLADLNLNTTSSTQSLSRRKLETGLAQEKHLAEIDKIFTKKHILPAIKKTARKLTPVVTAPYTNESDRPALTLRRGSDAQNASILRPHRLSTGVQPPALPQLLVQAPDDDGEEEEEELVKESAKRKTPSGEKIFIEVAHLEEGDVFGLEHVLLGNISDVTSCSLVSAGAEVVLISKKFFQKHLTEETAKTIREKIRPLPSEASLKAQLKAQISWQAFKADLFTRQTMGQQGQGRSGAFARHPQITRQSTMDRGGFRTASQMS